MTIYKENYFPITTTNKQEEQCKSLFSYLTYGNRFNSKLFKKIREHYSNVLKSFCDYKQKKEYHHIKSQRAKSLTVALYKNRKLFNSVLLYLKGQVAQLKTTTSNIIGYLTKLISIDSHTKNKPFINSKVNKSNNNSFAISSDIDFNNQKTIINNIQ